jgi:hypothetical protein
MRQTQFSRDTLSGTEGVVPKPLASFMIQYSLIANWQDGYYHYYSSVALSQTDG